MEHYRLAFKFIVCWFIVGLVDKFLCEVISSLCGGSLHGFHVNVCHVTSCHVIVT